MDEALSLSTEGESYTSNLSAMVSGSYLGCSLGTAGASHLEHIQTFHEHSVGTLPRTLRNIANTLYLGHSVAASHHGTDKHHMGQVLSWWKSA